MLKFIIVYSILFHFYLLFLTHHIKNSRAQVLKETSGNSVGTLSQANNSPAETCKSLSSMILKIGNTIHQFLSYLPHHAYVSPGLWDFIRFHCSEIQEKCLLSLAQEKLLCHWEIHVFHEKHHVVNVVQMPNCPNENPWRFLHSHPISISDTPGWSWSDLRKFTWSRAFF